MSNIENQICQAVDIIVQRAMSQAEFDRTIQGTVLSCIDATIGKYKIKYQDNTFYAYSSNAEVTYSNGSSVYILVPGNDMSRDKTILGTTKRLGTNYINTVTGQDTYNIIGNNVVYTNSNDLGFISYDTYQTEETIVLYDKNAKDNILQLDTIGFNDYITQASHLICGATFRTELPLEQQSSGDYGIIFTLNFKDRTTQEPVSKYYVINADKMTGNPYKLLYDTEQVGYFEIDGSNFIEVESVVLFAKSFPTEAPINPEDYKKDIFIKNFKLYAATHMTDEALSSYSLTLLTPQGTYFKEGVTTSETKKAIQAQVKVKGKVVDPNSQLLSYYWFSEKADVTTTSSEYNSYGGQGWECLNSKKVGTNLNQNNKWQDDDDTHYVMAKDIPVKEKKYKCVVVYDGNSFSKEVTFKNYDAEYSLEIVSDSGTTFYLDSGNPILTCNIKDKTNQLPSNIEEYEFAWSSVDNTNYYKAETAMTKSPRQLQPQINLITGFKTFKCSVYTPNFTNFLGTASITLNNILESKDSIYTLIIENGNQIFKYDENGDSPASDLQDTPILIPELTYYIYDNAKGVAIKGNTLPNANAKWYVPSNNTLLKGLGNGQENIIEEAFIFTGASLSYSIAERYQFNSLRNNIELRVEYDGIQLIARTNFLFTKEGEAGTNGTSFVCRIVPNIISGQVVSQPILINGQLNYMPQEHDKWFRVELWQDGNLIFNDYKPGTTLNTNEYVDVFEWSVLKNKYGRYNASDASVKDITESSNIKILNGTILTDTQFSYQNIPSLKSLFYLNNDSDIAISNIVKVGLRYDNKEFYCTQIVPTINHTDGYIVEINGGFQYVLYGSDGSNPKYDNSSPFSIKVFDNNGIDISKTLAYNWKIESYIYKQDKNTRLWYAAAAENLKEDTYKTDKLNSSSYYVKPSNQISGECVSNNVCCTVTRPGSGQIAFVRIPVHMYLNRFGLASLNGWDGNSVTIDEEGGFILAPQMGAGVKDENNRFTGVVMGEVKESNQTEADIGLIGYSQGQRSFFLDAETGKTILGVAGEGQIILDPTEKEAVIRSGNYSTEKKTGMEINLTQPYINFGSGRFNVSPQGYLSCSGARVEGEIHAIIGNDDDNNKNEIKFSDNDSFIHFRKKSYNEQYSFECRLSPDEFYIRSQNLFDSEDYSGMEYNNGTLEIIGKITATSGTIGGWAIEKDRIRAVDGCLILYADGTILGTKSDSGKSGILASEYDYERTEVSGGSIQMYRRDSLDLDWDKDGVKKRQGRIYTNDKYGGGLTLSADGDRPLCFSAGGKLLMKLKHDGVKDKSPQNPRLCFVATQDGKEIEQTSLYRKKVLSQDFEFQLTSSYKLQETSLKNLVNSHCVTPDKVSFDDSTNIITETWTVEREEIEEKEVENEETGEMEIQQETVIKKHTFSRQFSLTVENEGTEEENVTALNVLDKDGNIVHSIQFEGF